MKQLIVNADDFGRSPGVTRGILDSHRRGIVTSTTIMINYPDAPAALGEALRDAPRLGVGLHLNLTSGPPVSPPAAIPSLVKPDGMFYHISEWVPAFRAFDPADIERELTAQFERFVSLAGQPPDHLDSHHHAVYLLPATLRVTLRLAADHGLPLRHAPLDEPPPVIAGMVTGMLRGKLTETEALDIAAQLQDALVTGPAPFWPARFEMGFYGPTATLGDLLVILTNLPPDSVSELMTHPGYVDDALIASRGYVYEREAEVNHLTHAATRECVQAEGIQLITFGDLPRP